MVYRCEENLGVKGPNKNKNKNKDVGLRMTMPQAAGKKGSPLTSDSVRINVQPSHLPKFLLP